MMYVLRRCRYLCDCIVKNQKTMRELRTVQCTSEYHKYSRLACGLHGSESQPWTRAVLLHGTGIHHVSKDIVEADVPMEGNGALHPDKRSSDEERKDFLEKNMIYLKSIVQHKSDVVAPSHSAAASDVISNTLLSCKETDNEDRLTGYSSESELTEVNKYEIEKVFNLASIVNDSETLQQLVQLGVDLSKVEAIENAGTLLIRLDFKRDVQPILLFLQDIGVQDSDLGGCLTRNPLMLGVAVEQLQPAVDYCVSKNFNREDIARIVTKVPQILTMKVADVDRILGKYQKLFRLDGQEVREIITRLPKLIVWNPSKTKDLRLYVGEFLGFSDAEQKQLFLACPKLYMSNKQELGRRFDLLHNTMNIPHSQIVHWPGALRTRLFVIKQRHEFLTHLSRAQYDPKLENYVSLRALVSGRDRDFCYNVAKTSVHRMQEFLKTL